MTQPTTVTQPQRVASIDALRGLVMSLMLAEALHLSGLGKSFPESGLAQFISFHTSHVAWDLWIFLIAPTDARHVTPRAAGRAPERRPDDGL